MSDNGEAVPKKVKNLIRWTPFRDMPRWQREMERMFGDSAADEDSTAETKKNPEKITDGSPPK